MNISKQRRSLVCALSILLFAGLAHAGSVIKFATLAPEGSAWMRVMKEWNQEITEKSKGGLSFKIYSGGVSGDEKDVVKKVRLGQLQAGGFTGVGLGEIAPKVRLLDAPFLFENVDEIDHVTRTFKKEWDEAFDKGGYVLLGWAEVGFVYLFTNKPVVKLTELKGIKMWIWEGDPIAESLFRSINVSPIPLSITDVMTSLQTGMIDGVYSSPLGMLALQWFTKTKFMYDYKLANASGAVLVSKTFFNALPKDQQALLLATGEKHMRRLTEMSREENRSSLAALKKSGVQIVEPRSPEDAQQYAAAGVKARASLVGRLYDQTLLDRVTQSLEQFRKAHKTKK
jgi:TRAP-type C4-dicarboxylate transport system substrate-binding protein